MFVARVAGNFANLDIIASMEFACKVSGSKVVLVLGHDNCGAVGAAIDGVELGNITKMLKNIQPALESLEGFPGEKSSSNAKFLGKVTERNVQMTIEKIKARSPILRHMEKSGDILIVGAVYDLETGIAIFLD